MMCGHFNKLNNCLEYLLFKRNNKKYQKIYIVKTSINKFV